MPKEAAKLLRESSKLGTSPTNSSDHLLPNPAAELARLQIAEKERRELYEIAQNNFKNIVEEAREDNIKAYKAAKLKIAECGDEVAAAVAICREAQEKYDERKEEKSG